ncbi:MAG TPA: cyclic nucleotide-binding domain-containing protein, partial [Candidatus Binataceae bacterium]|nr:cyclic nucleotide-binding domain-containing protein [Candidatus Binataceae bacterium]
MDAGTLVRTPPEELWKRLAPLSLFADFTEQQRQSFQDAYRREDGMRVQHFDPRGRVCDKGQYELDLCFILRGSVDLYDHQPTTGYTRVASLAEGSFYGELGAIGGIPRSTDVVAGSDGVELFYLPRYCLKYLFINSQARERLNQLYQERALRVIARENEIFQGVPNDFITRLIPQCRIDFYDLRGVVLVNQGEPGDALYYVRDGYVMVRQRRADGSSRILGYLNAGEYFAEAAILPDVDRREVVESVQKEVGGEMT